MTNRTCSGAGPEIYLRPLKLRALSELKLSESHCVSNVLLLAVHLCSPPRRVVKLLTLAWMTVSLVAGWRFRIL